MSMPESVERAAIALEWVKPPQQARSQRTLERLLDAAEELLEERGESGTTIATIVSRADSSVGAFYARFGDKETLLRCVYERFYEQARATADAALAPERWTESSLTDAICATIRFVTDVFRQRRGVIAALSAKPPGTQLSAPADVLGDLIAEKILALAEAHGQSVAHPEPARAAKTCVWLVLSALSSWAQSGAGDAAPPASADRFAADIAEMTFGFLFGLQTRTAQA